MTQSPQSPHSPASRESDPVPDVMLTDHERRVLSFLDQRGPTHRRAVVWELAAPDSKIGRARDTGSALGGGSSGNGEALIMGRWCRRLIRQGFVKEVRDGRGFYCDHAVTPEGRALLRGSRP